MAKQLESLENEIYNELQIEAHHLSYIFPDDTNKTCTLTSHVNANTWSAYVEIVDSAAGTLAAAFAVIGGDVGVSSIMVEETSVKDKHYIIEISYGAAHTVVGYHRFVSGDLVKLGTIQQVRLRTRLVPSGETVYYRLKCEDGANTCVVSFRFHCHDCLL